MFTPEPLLAEHRRPVTRFLEEIGHRFLPRQDLARDVKAPGAIGGAPAPSVVACEDGVTGGRAKRRRRVRVGEAHALVRQPLDRGGADLRLWIVALEIPPAHVIRENQENVRFDGRLPAEDGQRSTDIDDDRSECFSNPHIKTASARP